MGASEAMLVRTDFGGGVDFEPSEQEFLQDFRHRVQQRDWTVIDWVR